MKMLDAGEKIKKLRLEIGLKQEDLASDEVTRSLISMIENNKRNLTYNTARVVAEKLNQYYVNLGKEITPDFLLETKAEQAERMIKEELDKLHSLLKNPLPESAITVEGSIQKLINFAKEWELDWVIAQLHESRGEFYYDTYQYNEALKDLFIAQEYYLKERKYERVVTIYNIIGMSYYGLMIFQQALLYYNQAQQLMTAYNLDELKELQMDLIYNKILCYRRLTQYDLVFMEIGNYKKLSYHTKQQYAKVLLVEANTFSDLGNYDKAVRIYERLLSKYEHQRDLTLLVHLNYIYLLLKKGAYEESREKINHALTLKVENKPRYTIELMLSSAQLYLTTGNIKEALEQINQGLVLAEKINDLSLTIELHLLHAKAQIENTEFTTAEMILNKLEAFIRENSPFSDKLLDIEIHFLLLYNKARNYDKSIDHINKMYEFRKVQK